MQKEKRKSDLDATKLVTRIAESFGTRDPYKLCECLGIYVLFHRLAGIRGYHKRVGELSYIVISDTLPSYVQEFVCAHELGHWFLHRGLNRIFMDSKTFMEPGRFERSSDKFACQLLYGEPPLFSARDLYVGEIAECLSVPESDVADKLISFGIIP